jgi:hypothetical protein
MGTPNEEIYPTIRELPEWKPDFNVYSPPAGGIADLVPSMKDDEDMLDLLNLLLQVRVTLYTLLYALLSEATSRSNIFQRSENMYTDIYDSLRTR